jgi:hypothetical protein
MTAIVDHSFPLLASTVPEQTVRLFPDFRTFPVARNTDPARGLHKVDLELHGEHGSTLGHHAQSGAALTTTLLAI